MSRTCSVWLRTIAAIGVALWTLPGAAAEPRYTGVKDCARCHKKELIGDQYGQWKAAGHAKAFETLKSDAAVKIGKERGLAKPPHESDECLRCHATAHGLEPAQIFKKPLALTDGVQCESCHGPGSEYRKKASMADHEKAVAAGMLEPGKDPKICTGCHNQDSPTWDTAKGFDFEAMKKKIAHPIPAEVKGRYLEAEREARKKAKER